MLLRRFLSQSTQLLAQVPQSPASLNSLRGLLLWSGPIPTRLAGCFLAMAAFLGLPKATMRAPKRPWNGRPP